jgi:hypothetical protein
MFADMQRESAVQFSFMGATSKNTALKLVDDFEWVKNRLKIIAEETANKWKEKMDAIKQHADVFLGGMNDLSNQYFTNRSTAIENDYIRQKEAIEKSKMTEEEKNKAFEKLDADYAAKKKTGQRTEFIISKALRAGETLMASWQAATAALLVPPIPNFFLAAVTKAFGVAQAALILAQPIPLAKGAIFSQPTILPAVTGRTYLAGESGREIVASPENLRKAIFGSQGFSRAILPINIYLGGQKIKEVFIEIVERASVEGTLKIAAKAIA